MSDFFMGPNKLTPWIEESAFAGIKGHQQPTTNRPKVVQVIRFAPSPENGVPFLEIHDGECSIMAFLTTNEAQRSVHKSDASQASEFDPTPQRGCVVRLNEWRISSSGLVHHNESINESTMSNNGHPAVCLDVQGKVETFGGHGIGIVQNIIDVHCSTLVMQAFLSENLKKQHLDEPPQEEETPTQEAADLSGLSNRERGNLVQRSRDQTTAPAILPGRTRAQQQTGKKQPPLSTSNAQELSEEETSRETTGMDTITDQQPTGTQQQQHHADETSRGINPGQNSVGTTTNVEQPLADDDTTLADDDIAATPNRQAEMSFGDVHALFGNTEVYEQILAVGEEEATQGESEEEEEGNITGEEGQEHALEEVPPPHEESEQEEASEGNIGEEEGRKSLAEAQDEEHGRRSQRPSQEESNDEASIQEDNTGEEEEKKQDETEELSAEGQVVEEEECAKRRKQPAQEESEEEASFQEGNTASQQEQMSTEDSDTASMTSQQQDQKGSTTSEEEAFAQEGNTGEKEEAKYDRRALPAEVPEEEAAKTRNPTSQEEMEAEEASVQAGNFAAQQEEMPTADSNIDSSASQREQDQRGSGVLDMEDLDAFDDQSKAQAGEEEEKKEGTEELPAAAQGEKEGAKRSKQAAQEESMEDEASSDEDFAAAAEPEQMSTDDSNKDSTSQQQQGSVAVAQTSPPTFRVHTGSGGVDYEITDMDELQKTFAQVIELVEAEEEEEDEVMEPPPIQTHSIDLDEELKKSPPLENTPRKEEDKAVVEPQEEAPHERTTTATSSSAGKSTEKQEVADPHPSTKASKPTNNLEENNLEGKGKNGDSTDAENDKGHQKAAKKSVVRIHNPYRKQKRPQDASSTCSSTTRSAKTPDKAIKASTNNEAPLSKGDDKQSMASAEDGKTLSSPGLSPIEHLQGSQDCLDLSQPKGISDLLFSDEDSEAEEGHDGNALETQPREGICRKTLVAELEELRDSLSEEQQEDKVGGDTKEKPVESDSSRKHRSGSEEVCDDNPLSTDAHKQQGTESVVFEGNDSGKENGEEGKNAAEHNGDPPTVGREAEDDGGLTSKSQATIPCSSVEGDFGKPTTTDHTTPAASIPSNGKNNKMDIATIISARKKRKRKTPVFALDGIRSVAPPEHINKAAAETYSSDSDDSKAKLPLTQEPLGVSAPVANPTTEGVPQPQDSDTPVAKESIDQGLVEFEKSPATGCNLPSDSDDSKARLPTQERLGVSAPVANLTTEGVPQPQDSDTPVAKESIDQDLKESEKSPATGCNLPLECREDSLPSDEDPDATTVHSPTARESSRCAQAFPLSQDSDTPASNLHLTQSQVDNSPTQSPLTQASPAPSHSASEPTDDMAVSNSGRRESAPEGESSQDQHHSPDDSVTSQLLETEPTPTSSRSSQATELPEERPKLDSEDGNTGKSPSLENQSQPDSSGTPVSESTNKGSPEPLSQQRWSERCAEDEANTKPSSPLPEKEFPTETKRKRPRGEPTTRERQSHSPPEIESVSEETYEQARKPDAKLRGVEDQEATGNLPPKQQARTKRKRDNEEDKRRGKTPGPHKRYRDQYPETTPEPAKSQTTVDGSEPPPKPKAHNIEEQEVIDLVSDDEAEPSAENARAARTNQRRSDQERPYREKRSSGRRLPPHMARFMRNIERAVERGARKKRQAAKPWTCNCDGPSSRLPGHRIRCLWQSKCIPTDGE